MEPKSVCRQSTLCFLLVLILPTISYGRLWYTITKPRTTESEFDYSLIHQLNRDSIREQIQRAEPTIEDEFDSLIHQLNRDSIREQIQRAEPTIEDTSDPLIQLSIDSTTEVVQSADALSPINLSSKNVTESYTVNTSLSECDRSKQIGVVIMIGFNHFGFTKSSYLMQATLHSMRKLQNEGALVQLIIDDLAPIRNVGKKDWVVTSMIRKLRVGTFTPVRSSEMNTFAFLFVDKTMDFGDERLFNEMRRVHFHDIYLYLVIVGEGVDMAVINQYLVTPERAIFIASYDELRSSLSSKLTEKLCVRQSQPWINIDFLKIC